MSQNGDTGADTLGTVSPNGLLHPTSIRILDNEGNQDNRECLETCAHMSPMMHPTTVRISGIPGEVIGRGKLDRGQIQQRYNTSQDNTGSLGPEGQKVGGELEQKAARSLGKNNNSNSQQAIRTHAIPPPAFVTHPKYRKGL